MTLMRNTLLILACLLAGCQQASQETPWQQIDGRDRFDETGAIKRYPVYRARVPKSWVRHDPPTDSSNSDSRLPICSFEIDGIEIHVHNFPVTNIEKRIPPPAQVARWQQQVGGRATLVEPVAHGGFAGLHFEADKGSERVVAWAMQLAPEHYYKLASLARTDLEREYYQQMQSDYTIKVNGPQEAIEQHRSAINAFARSFELIQAIPAG